MLDLIAFSHPIIKEPLKPGFEAGDRKSWDNPKKSNLFRGFLGGCIGSTIGAMIWAWLWYFTHYKITWIAVIIGVLTGFGTRRLGRGSTVAFRLIGAGWSFIGCLEGTLGYLLLVWAFQKQLPVTTIIQELNLQTIWRLLMITYSHWDWIFYLMAMGLGFFLSLQESTPRYILSQTSKE